MLCAQTSSNFSTPAHKKAIKYLQLTESRAIQVLLDWTGSQPKEQSKKWNGTVPGPVWIGVMYEERKYNKDWYNFYVNILFYLFMVFPLWFRSEFISFTPLIPALLSLISSLLCFSHKHFIRVLLKYDEVKNTRKSQITANMHASFDSTVHSRTEKKCPALLSFSLL